MADYNYAVADYVDFEFHVKQVGKQERQFANKLNLINTKYVRKEKMAEKGLLSEAAHEKIFKEKRKELAHAFSEHIVVGWKGEFKGKKLGKFCKDKCAEILGETENEDLFLDLMETATDLANFTKEQEEAEIKN